MRPFAESGLRAPVARGVSRGAVVDNFGISVESEDVIRKTKRLRVEVKIAI